MSCVTETFTDAVGRVIAVRDPMGQVTMSEYDARDRLKKVVDPMAGAVEFGYNLAGNMTSHKDQKSNTTSYGFNNLGFVSSKTDALANAETYLYGANGKLSRITDRKGQVTGLTYDDLQRVSQVGFGATSGNSTAFTSTIDYTHDGADRVTQIADSAGGTLTRAYDNFDRLTQEVTPEGSVSYTYDAAGRRATMTVAGQTQVVYTWDNANRLTHITQGSDVIVFAYDNAGRRTSTTLANGVVQSNVYDNANQLTSITYTKGANTLGDLVYTYDAAGRRVKVSGSLARTNLPAAVNSASYNANNQLTNWAGTTHSYDLNGNLTGDGSKTYTWNARDQLSGISGGVSASFTYDGAGRRKSKTIAGTQTGFLYDGLNFVQELAGTTPKANLITGRIDEMFLRKDTAATRHPISDVLGSVIALTDAAGTMATEYTFEPYGNTTASGAADTNSQGYTAREDDGTGLFYYRARYYTPGQSRFIAEDPIGWNSGQVNNYAYVGGDPVGFRDPKGESGAAAATIGIGLGFGCMLTPGCKKILDEAIRGCLTSLTTHFVGEGGYGGDNTEGCKEEAEACSRICTDAKSETVGGTQTGLLYDNKPMSPDPRELARRRIADLFGVPVTSLEASRSFRDFPRYSTDGFSSNPYDILLEDIQDMRSQAELGWSSEVETVGDFEECAMRFAADNPEGFRKRVSAWTKEAQMRTAKGLRGLVWRLLGL